MGRLRLRAPVLLLGLLPIAVCGCGGGTAEIQPPPPPPDFSITFSGNSVNVQQGAASNAVQLSITPSNGFSSSVQVTLTGLPSGIVSNPASLFSLTAATPVSLLFSAAVNAATGNFTVVAAATSGSLSHSASLSLSVQSGIVATLPRTTYVRTDSLPIVDNPAGEPHRHHLGYDPAADLGAASDGTMFVLQANGTTEIRAADLTLASIPASPELQRIPSRVQVPGIILHPSGALLYQPFLTGTPGSPGVKGGIDVFDAHSGALRLRILLSQQFMTDVDGLHGSFFTIDENGQRLFAITSTDGSAQNAGVSTVGLASVPLGIGTLTPASGSAAGETQVTVGGSGFQSSATVTIGGKPATVSFKDRNTLMVTTPPLSAGPQRITILNLDGESTSLDAAFVAN